QATWVFYDMVFPLSQQNGVVATTPTLALAPALAQDTQVVLQTIYYPLDLESPDDPVEQVIQPFGEAVIAFAMAWLLQQVNDVDASRWMAEGMMLLNELKDAVADVSDQNTEFLDTGLWTEQG